ncbi:MAG: HlyD family efflux transporter periplasmic adaptor subunit [Planctomycetota bacterium]
MSTETAHSRAPSGPEQTSDTPQASMVRELSSRLHRLTEETRSPASYYKRASAEIVRAFRSPYGAVSVRIGAEVIEDYWHQGSTDPRFWKKPIEELLNESLEHGRPVARRFTSRDARFHIALLSVMLRDINGSMIGVLSLVVRCERAEDAARHRELLESIAAQAALGAARVEARGSGEADGEQPGAELSKVAGYRSATELAFALVASLRSKFGCEQAAIGIATGSRCRVLAVSGLDEFSDRSAVGRTIRDAMGEAVDAGRGISSQTGEACGYTQHVRWLESCGPGAVASVPVEAAPGVRVVVSLRRPSDMGFRADELEQVSTLIEPYAPAFDLIRRATRSTVSHARSSAAESTKSLIGRGAWARKAAACVAVALIAWVAFGRLTYSVSTSATVEPSRVRHVAAPFGGTLEAVLVAPGDEVAAGELLAQFDVTDLWVERRRVEAEAAIARIDEDLAIAEGSAVDVALSRAERERAGARLAEIDRQIGRARVVAPFAGRVVEGDVRRRVGESLPLGEPLFMIADASEWRIEAAVPQRVADELGAGLVGTFAPAARPEAEWSVSIERVHPTPEVRGSQAVYIAEAALPDIPDWFKPGMEGNARIELGSKPVWWIVSNRVVDYLRLNFWL